MNYGVIDVTRIGVHEDFEYAGKVFHGLEDLLQYATNDHDKSESLKESPYVIKVGELYSCFDAEDYANENRYCQTFYFTTDKTKAESIMEDYKKDYFSQLFPILDPETSLRRVKEHHLPYIFYRGEGDMMQVVQDRNADDDRQIILTDYLRFLQNLRSRDFERGCLYGPPTDYKLPHEWDDDIYRLTFDR